MGDKKIKSEETVENKSMNKELKKNDHIKDDMEKEKVKLTEGKTKKNDLGSNEEVQILERKKCRRRKSREEGELSHMDSEDIDNIVDWASGSDVNKSEKLTKKNICLKKSNDDVMKSNDDVKKLDDAAKKSNDDVGKLPNQNKRKEVPKKDNENDGLKESKNNNIENDPIHDKKRLKKNNSDKEEKETKKEEEEKETKGYNKGSHSSSNSLSSDSKYGSRKRNLLVRKRRRVRKR